MANKNYKPCGSALLRTDVSSKIKFTGERALDNGKSDLYLISLERYKFASAFVKDKKVLDIACGSGYGTNYLSAFAKDILGVDVDKKTIEYCRLKYSRKNLHFKLTEKENTEKPFLDKFDVIVCFETIEHIKDYKNFLFRLKQYLKERGVLILSTPNNFRRINPPKNKFHIREFDTLEFTKIIKDVFNDAKISVFGQVKTNFKRSNGIPEEKFNLRSILKFLIASAYQIDKKYFNVLSRMEHLSIYKEIGRLQREYPLDEKIYPISINEDFLNPEVSIFVVEI